MRDFFIESKKLFGTKSFLISILGLVVLFMLSESLIDTRTSRGYMTIELLYGEGRKFVESSSYESAWIILWKNVTNMWLPVFAPLFISLSCVFENVEEKKTGCIKFVVLRVGNLKYSIIKVVSGALYSGMVFLIAYLIYGVILSLLFNDLSFYNLSSEELLFLLPEKESIFITKRLLGSFLYGVTAGSVGIIVATYLKDKYLVSCLPVLAGFFINNLFLKWTLAAMNLEDFDKIQKSLELNSTLDPMTCFEIFYQNKGILKLVIAIGIYIIVFLLMFLKTKSRSKKDDWN